MKKKMLALRPKSVSICFILLLAAVVLTANGCVSFHHFPPPDHPELEQANVYYINQKVLSFGARFVIRDEMKRPVFYVKGKVFTIGDRLTVMDRSGNKIAYIMEKVFSFMKSYVIYHDGRVLAKIKKKFTVFKDKFTVNVPGGTDLKVVGDFSGHQYRFTRNGRDIAYVTKKFLTFGDRYRVEILPGEDDLLILSTAIILDMVCHEHEDHGHHHHHH